MSDSEQEVLQRIWEEAQDKFNFPAIKGPEIVEALPGENSAAFNFVDRNIRISREFVDELAQHVHPRRALQALVDHETGHYVYFPRELSHKLYLLASADRWFKKKTPAIFAWYSDLADEGMLFKEGISGQELLDTRLASAKAVKAGASVNINRLMYALYANSFGFPQIELNEDEKKYFGKLSKIPYIDLDLKEHLASLYRFGKAIEDLIQDPPHPPQCRCNNASLEGVPIKEIDGALSDILGKLGPRGYNLVRGYLAKVRPDFKDPFDAERKTGGQQAGLMRSDFQLNDGLIPLYRRWASVFGLYIAKRPMEKDTTAEYISGKKEYEMGDPLHRLDIFGSRGYVGIPGLSKVFEQEEGTIPAVEWLIPHLMVGVDSSGSMDHPNSPRGAMQVVAAYVLGRNYHANGSHVGAWNFSSDMAFLPLTRDIDAYYSLVTAYWGGGTILNTEKLKEFLEKYDPLQDLFRRRRQGVVFTDERDYERALALLPEEKRKEFLDKSLNVDMSKLRVKVKKLDNVLITDGYIANAEEVLRYLQGMGEITRNFVFLTDKAKYDEWSKIDLPNTWVYPAEKPGDLMRLALGRSRALVEEAPAGYVGYRNEVMK